MRKDRFLNNISIVVSAPSGTGKTTVINMLIEKYGIFDFAVSTTTRPMRTMEKDRKSYYFISIDEFKKKIQNEEFLEWALVHRNYYGTTKKEVDRIKSTGKIPIFDVDVQGAKQLKNKLENAVFILIIPPSIEVLKERLQKRRSDSKEQIAIRVENSIKELEEFEHYDYVIVNDIIERAFEDLDSIITALS